MAVWVVTGKLGGGKSLISVSKIQEALMAGKKVATNLDIRLDKMFHRYTEHTLIRLPDKPTVHDMEAAGMGNESYDEDKNGLLVLDELGTWLNSRNWQDKARAPLLDWFLHARKRGWDVIFIVQDIDMIDSQFRKALGEMTVFCRRLDRMNIPFISTITGICLGFRVKGPRIHMARVVYGTSVTDMMVDRWVYKGSGLYSAYDTRQVFIEDYPHSAYSLLPPKYLNYRMKAKRGKEFAMRLTKIIWRKFKSPVALATGVLLGVSAGVLALGSNNQQTSVQPVSAENKAPQLEPGELEPHIVRLKEVLSRLYVTGTMNTQGHTIYQLADINDELERTRFTSLDLARMGLMLKPHGHCRLDVKVADETIPLFCMRSF